MGPEMTKGAEAPYFTVASGLVIAIAGPAVRRQSRKSLAGTQLVYHQKSRDGINTRIAYTQHLYTPKSYLCL